MNNNLSLFESIIFSNKVEKRFYKEYNSNENFKKWLLNILPEVELCFGFNQKSIWHLYDVLKHTLMATGKANKLSKNLDKIYKKVISYAMFFHDIGKPQTAVLKEGSRGEYYSFKTHNLKSLEIFNRSYKSFVLEQNEILIIQFLIENHDTFNDLKVNDITESFVINKVEEMKKVLPIKDVIGYFKCLIIMAKSDNFAQNKELTKSTLNVVKTFEKVFKNIKNYF